MKVMDANQEVELIDIPVQKEPHECQHVSSGACLKCRYPMTWRQFIYRRQNNE